MEYSSITLVLSVALTSVCSAEYTADTVYEFLTNRLDNVFFDIRNMRRDIAKLSDQIDILGVTNGPAQSQKKIKKMLETFRNEINDLQASTEGIESSVLKKLEGIVEEKLASCHNHDDNSVQTLQLSARVEMKKYPKSLPAEKQFIREITKDFENIVNNLEQEMDSFTKASWKGEKGSQGLLGVCGLKGSKGDRGLSTKGQKGDEGDNGLSGQSGLPGMSGEKGQKGETGYAGAKGQKGSKGSRQTENDVHFTAMLMKDLLNMGANEIIICDEIRSNAGDAYSSTTGKFTAPISGTYLFMFNVKSSGESKTANVNLLYNRTAMASAVVDTWHNGHDATSGNAAVFHVTKGESVWVQTSSYSGRYDIHYWYTSFSGVLLHAS